MVNESIYGSGSRAGGEITFFRRTLYLLIEPQWSVVMRGGRGALSGAWKVSGREVGNGKWGGRRKCMEAARYRLFYYGSYNRERVINTVIMKLIAGTK